MTFPTLRLLRDDSNRVLFDRCSGAAPPSTPAEAWQTRLLRHVSRQDRRHLFPCRLLASPRALEPQAGGRHRPLAHARRLAGGAHSIASDGVVYVVEDTGRDGLRVYGREGDEFKRIQEIHGMPRRPHRVRYDPQTKAFYVVGAVSQDIYKLVRDKGGLKQVYRKHLDFLGGAYTRSITLADGAMYFVSGPGSIHKTAYRDDSFTVLAKYRVPEGMASTNDLFRSDDGWWYLTATSLKVVRARSLDGFGTGRFEDVSAEIGLHGTPYYLSKIDGRYYVPAIAERNGILSFVHEGGKISDVPSPL